MAMSFYQKVKSALSQVDAVVGATNSSFKILNDFIKKMEDKDHTLLIYRIYLIKDKTSLVLNYTVYDNKEDTITIRGPIGISLFDSKNDQWNQMIPTDQDDGMAFPKDAEILWDKGIEDEIEEREQLKRVKLYVFKGYLRYPEGDKITTQAQYLSKVKLVKEAITNPHFVRLFLRQGNTNYPGWCVGYAYFYYLYVEMDDGSQTIIATVSCGWETDRIEGTGLEIVR